MIEQTVEIATRDGDTTTFIVHPDRGGPHPLILFLMDAPGIREELRDMARRFAAAGHYVMLPNLFHRQGLLELPPLPPQESLARMYRLIDTLSIAQVMDDCDAMLAFADRDPAARPGPTAAVGYCMSGQY
ncbi:MAG: hydrolase, partial [Caulobacteraceae bacterium]|nr:hydrolase [Caulobacteraceae bacterium]